VQGLTIRSGRKLITGWETFKTEKKDGRYSRKRKVPKGMREKRWRGGVLQKRIYSLAPYGGKEKG